MTTDTRRPAQDTAAPERAICRREQWAADLGVTVAELEAAMRLMQEREEAQEREFEARAGRVAARIRAEMEAGRG